MQRYRESNSENHAFLPCTLDFESNFSSALVKRSIAGEEKVPNEKDVDRIEGCKDFNIPGMLSSI